MSIRSILTKIKKGIEIMKKILAIAVAVLTLFSVSAFAFADGGKDTWPDTGITLTYPVEFSDIKGIYMPVSFGMIQDGVCAMTFNYFAISEEESDIYNEKAAKDQLTEEDQAKILNASGTLCIVIGIDGGRGPAEILDEIMLEGVAESDLIQVGQHDDMTYYALKVEDDDFLERIDPKYAEEYTALQSSLIEALKNAEYVAPQAAGDSIKGMALRFETTDIDGNPVKSEDLFKAHAVTMVNIWATYCGPCKFELPELGELARSLEAAGKDAAVVGICCDAEQKLADCKAILAENKVDYLNLLPDYDMLDQMGIALIPTTLFVDRDGNILKDPIEGVPSNLSFYEKTIDSLLAGNTSGAETPASEQTAANENNAYRVIVTDNSGNPVKGAMVQFCDDSACMMGITAEDGVAVFPDAKEGHPYIVHILKAPEGYQNTAEEFSVPSTFCDTAVTLQKAI